MKSKALALLILCLCQTALAQNKYERETRIKREQFPKNALELIQDHLSHAKKIRFYQETDSTKNSYEAKFKKGRLHYSVEFDQQGTLEDIEFRITEVDIPEETWLAITKYLEQVHPKYRIKKIQQQYPVGDRATEKTVHDAFQNLILDYVNYEVVFAAKANKGFQTYEALFNSEGQLIIIRKSFPPSYDHVLY